MIIFVLIALAVVAYVLWNNNKKWQEQATMNDSLKKMFPQLAKSVKKESDKEEDGGVAKEQVNEEQQQEYIQEDKEEQEHVEENEQQEQSAEIENGGQEEIPAPDPTQEISEELALKIRGFAIKIATATEPITYTADEQQFYDNNKEAIEAELLLVRDELEQDKKQATGGKGRGRHKKDCECEKCEAKRKEKEKLNS